MIKAGIIGGTGYTGGELIRLLLNHPECRTFVCDELF
jgi:N-acetyl-gamma-glutamyl-phosphate reductase